MAAVQTEIIGEVAKELGTVFLHRQAGVLARDREPGIHIAPPGTQAPVLRGPAQLAQVGPRFHRAGGARAPAFVRVAADEAQAAVVRIEHRGGGGFSAGLLHLQVGATPGLQGEVGAFEAVVLATAVLVDPGTADRHVVAEPLAATRTVGHVVAAEAKRHVFVVHQQQLVVAIERHVAGDAAHVLAGELSQRTGQDQAPLQIVDLVVHAFLQGGARFGAAGGAIAHFQHDLLRAGQHIGVAQVVQAAAGAEEFTVARRGLRLRAEYLHLRARLTQRRGLQRTPVQCTAVQRADVLAVLGAGDAGGVVAPHGLALVPVHAQVQAPLRIHVAVGGGVIAIHRVVQIRVEATEHILCVGLGEIAEQILQLTVLGVGLRSHQVFAAQLALQIERQPALAEEAVVVTIIGGERLQIAAGAVPGDGDIGNGDQEQVATGDIHVQLPLCGGRITGFDTDVVPMLADRLEELGGELLLQIDREVLTVDAHAAVGLQVAAVQTHARAVDGNVLQAQHALPVDAVAQLQVLRTVAIECLAQRLLHVLAGDLQATVEIGRGDQLDALQARFIEGAAGAVRTCDVDQLIAGAQLDLRWQFTAPFGVANVVGRQLDARQRRDQIGIGTAIQRHLQFLDERGVVVVTVEPQRADHPAIFERHGGRGLHAQAGRHHGRVFGGPHHATVGQLGHELATARGDIRRDGRRHRHDVGHHRPGAARQRKRIGAVIADAQQQAVIVAAAVGLTADRCG